MHPKPQKIFSFKATIYFLKLAPTGAEPQINAKALQLFLDGGMPLILIKNISFALIYNDLRYYCTSRHRACLSKVLKPLGLWNYT